ncbi:ClbS/DfsB family four-helix bundle protein [Candidatus Bipolaricaulota bacterium]|nr:ClbS/DfsB family four-helix bundle protein [Candidatus Bipolaricaulota bacterium]TFH07734.1 MAG: ClbS/DfsB family four-helix bundle protein [Candidatus Atribacteria bacterium]
MTYEPLTVAELVDIVEETFGSWMQLLESVPSDQFEQPGVSGEWSLKDIIAHITWHENQMVEVMEARALVGSEWWELPTRERNAKIYEEYRSAPLSDVLDDATATHQQMIHWIKTLSDAELNEPGHFEEMPEDWLFGDILAQNTYLHYGDHAATVARWLSEAENRN